MTDAEEIELLAKACFDRQEWERVEDGQLEAEIWDDIDETAKDYWREFVKPLLSFIRAAELRGRVAGMREAADLIKAHRNAAPTFYWEDDEKALFNKIDRMVIAAASKLSPTT